MTVKIFISLLLLIILSFGYEVIIKRYNWSRLFEKAFFGFAGIIMLYISVRMNDPGYANLFFRAIGVVVGLIIANFIWKFYYKKSKWSDFAEHSLFEAFGVAAFLFFLQLN